MFLDSS